ncbi:hypothetical protein LOC67_20285 [Stieleria sp. JC731]|uniref:hypothetical protein n=1 Tax=Pirellulaceae TaxID=2691357 RepID=UPI001E39B835|nr:hypothetical protein [Stieleria sp. JC731]MCC9602895.1 hypothetical protein [Stieleria sp. JC731]
MSIDIVALSDAKAQADFVGWEEVPKHLKTRSQWESKFRKVRKGEKAAATIVVMRKMRIESADHEYEVPSQPYNLFHFDQTVEIKRTPLNTARQQFWQIFGQSNDRSKLIRWTSGDWTKDEFGKNVWDSTLDVWGWRTFTKEWFSRDKCKDHECGREIYGVFGAENSYYLLIDLDLHKGSLTLFLRRFAVLLDRFWGKDGCHFQISNNEAGGIHILLYFGKASPLKTRVRWLDRQLSELDQLYPECQFFQTQKSGKRIRQIEIYPDPQKAHRLPLARGRTMLLDRPLDLKNRRGQNTQDVVGYMQWLNDRSRQYMAKDDVFRYVVDRLAIRDLCSRDKEGEDTSKKPLVQATTSKNLTSEDSSPDFRPETSNLSAPTDYSLKGKARGALIAFWKRGEPGHFRDLNVAIYVTLLALRAEGCKSDLAHETVLRFCKEIPNKRLSSRLIDGFDEIERLIERDVAKIWNSGINGKWKTTADRWSSIGFRVSDKKTWAVSGNTVDVAVDCEQIEFNEEECDLIVNELVPLIVGRKQALKLKKQQEVIRAVAYFLRFVRCCDREIPVHALPKILSAFELKLGKHEKQRQFFNKLLDWNWIYIRADYYHPAKHGGKASKGRARAYGIGKAVIGKFTLPRTKTNRQEWSYILSSTFCETTENDFDFPSYEDQLAFKLEDMELGNSDLDNHGLRNRSLTSRIQNSQTSSAPLRARTDAFP